MQSRRKQGQGGWRMGAGVVFIAAVLAGWGTGRVPLAMPIVYLAMSVVAFFLYGRDKRAAQGRERRTRERTLHLVDLLGGWPGGLVAQGRFRHKTQKMTFQLVFLATVVVHCVALAWMLGAVTIPQLESAADALRP